LEKTKLERVEMEYIKLNQEGKHRNQKGEIKM